MKKMHGRMMILAIPLIFGFFLFYILPFFSSFYYSVIESAFSRRFVGLANYADVLGNDYYRLALKNTLQFTVTSVPALVLLALVLALMFHGMRGGAVQLRGAFVLPILLPSAAVIPLFRQWMGTSHSPVHAALAALSVDPVHIIRLPVYLLFLWKNTGFQMILIIAALSMIPQEIYEAAALDGAGRLSRFFRITLPLILNALFFVLILSMVHSLRVFKESYLLYGAYPDPSLYLVQHFMNNHFYKLNYQKLTSGAIFFAAILYGIVALCYRRISRREVTL